MRLQQRLRSKKHNVFTEEVNKKHVKHMCMKQPN